MVAARTWDGSRNTLFFGDNLEILQKHVPAGSVDLVYLDPPFNSKRDYSLLFKEKDGSDSAAQMVAFEDTWTWNQTSELAFRQIVASAPNRVVDCVEALRTLIGENDMLAYLVMMAQRLVELHTVLKPTGSLYLHCDPAASHYLKIVLDAIFGPERFRNEIIWRRTGAHGKTKRYGPIHDVILYYTKSKQFTWNQPYRPYMRGHVKEHFEQDAQGWKTAYYGNVMTGSGTRGGESGKPWKGVDPTAKGRHWAIPGKLIEGFEDDVEGMTQHQKMDLLWDRGLIKFVEGDTWPIYERYITPTDGTPVGDVWAYQPYTEGTVFGTEEGVDADVRWLNPRDKERLGYPTQKPVSLLERIVGASSNEGDVVLDPFCGCGTTIDAAQRLGRRWVGIDVTTLSVDLMDSRLRTTYGESVRDTYDILGVPRDLAGAQSLFEQNPFEFERWCVTQVSGQPNEKQVGDRGIDGVIRFPLDAKGSTGKIMVSVKGGATNPGHVRDLIGTVDTTRAAMGIFIMLKKPTRGILEAAARSGTYTHPSTHQSYPKIQVMTVEDLLAFKRPDAPSAVNPYYTAKRYIEQMEQAELF